MIILIALLIAGLIRRRPPSIDEARKDAYWMAAGAFEALVEAILIGSF